ncbi:MAG TPA: acetyl-CoA carboxylase biotin carboxyl carrier protein [Saprospiraceae bacterium]|nr:acetyl-CoA carboxylase biotin carboxyl carrier protein [Saprospiraceae bacterium]
MNFKEIQELIRLVTKSELSVFKYKNQDVELVIKTSKGSQEIPTQTVYAAAPVMQAAPIVAAPPAVAKAEASSAGSQDNAATSSGSDKKLLEIRSPMVGTFYRAPGPEKPQFVKVGDSVDIGSKVCIIEAMKLFNEIESEVKGTIVKVMVEDATPVEFDQVLFLVEP